MRKASPALALWALPLIFWYRWRLADAARIAKQTWTSQPGGRAEAPLVSTEAPGRSASVPQSLRSAAPLWLQRVRRGVTLLFAAEIGLAAWQLYAIMSFPGIRGGYKPFLFLLRVLMPAVHVLSALGIFYVSQRDPDPRSALSNPVRYWARCFAAVSLGLFLLETAPIWMGPRVISAVVGLALPYSRLAAAALGFACLRLLAQRASRPALGILTTVVIWILVARLGLGVLRANWGSDLSPFYSVVMSSRWGALAFATHVTGLIALFQYRRMLMTAIRRSASGRP